MTQRERLLARLEAIATAVRETGQGLALLGLGSAGQALQRLDDYSDLDFFVIARPGGKGTFLDSLAWLETIQPVVFSFMNTADGYKLLFSDAIFCEMAVFEPNELAGIPYSQARVVWQEEGSPLPFAAGNRLPPAARQEATVEWLTGEILSNLYVGLGRFRRGEKLSAARFIQSYAVERILELVPFIAAPQQGGTADPFDRDRRFEQRYPQIAAELPQFMPGYEKSPQAALAILAFLERYFPVNAAVKEAIKQIASLNPG